jgi:DNA polymerase III delta prime subunit
MKNYLHWSLRQLYLIFFWPTQFKREFEGDSPCGFKQGFVRAIRYLLGMFPWAVALAVLGNIVGGYAYTLLGIHFNWMNSWVAMPFGMGIGMVSGPVGVTAIYVALAAGFKLVSLGIGIAVGMAFIAVIGMARGVSIIVASGAAFGAAVAVIFGISEFAAAKGFLSAGWTLIIIGLVVIGTTFGALLSLGFGAPFSVGFGMKLCAAFGVVFGVMVSAAYGWSLVLAESLTFGVAFTLGCFRLTAYPFDAALSVTTYLIGRWQPSAAARAWRWCPVAWNELIWLPLPLAGKLLAMSAKQDREECFKQIAFVAAERKLQRRVALVAMIEVACDDLQANSMVEMADVTDRIGWTRDTLGGELPSELATTVTALDQVAQHAGQYLTLNNSYRKGEALQRAVDDMEEVQLYLIRVGGRFTRHLLWRANEWRALIEAERENLRKLTDVAREIPNPFVFGNPVMETEHNLFSGRKDIVRQIEGNVLGTRQAPTLLLHGPRRVGKTSILCQLPRLLGPDFAPAVVDCQNPAAIESEVMLLRYLSRALSEGLRLRRVHIEPLTTAMLEREPFSVFDRWMDAVEQEMPQRVRVLLCLDEYERLQSTLDAGWGGRFLDALRHILQHRPRVILMFTGAHTFQELGPEWTDRFISARRVRVGFLRREDVELLLRSPIPKFDMTYAPGALDAVIAATSCQPFLTQAVAFELVHLLNEQQRKDATPDDVEESVARALVSGGEYFANVWSEAGEQGQAILRAVVKGEVPPAFHVVNAWLRDHDVLNNDGSFVVEMMRRWVKSKSF